MKWIVALVLSCSFAGASAQKVDSIFFNLYTDSLKKGVYNYINVDAKMKGGGFLPLSSDEIILTSSAGRWYGNSLVIDSSYSKDSVVVVAVLKERPEVKKTVTIYMKKADEQPSLLSEEELLESWRRESKKKKKN